MPNSIEQVTLITREAIMTLRNMIYMPALSYKGFENEPGQKGDTVKVPAPYTFVANDMDVTNGVTPQAITDNMVEVKIDQWKEVTGALNDKEATLQDRVSLRRVLHDMMIPLAEAIETSGIKALTYNISSPSCVGGVTNAKLDADKIVDINTAQMGNKVPVFDANNMFGLLSVKDRGALLKQEKFTKADWTPDGGNALKSAIIGQRYGYNYYPSQLTAQPTITDTSGAVNNGAGYAIATKTLTVDGFSAAVPEGALLTFAGHTTVYTADAGSTTTSLKLKNGLTAAVVDDEVITVLDVSQNVFFHRNALAFAARPFAPSDNATPGALVSVQTFDGYSLRVEMWRDSAKKTNLITVDAMWGWKLLQQELAYKYYTQK